MLTEAIDKNGRRKEAWEFENGERGKCPFCGVPVHKKTSTLGNDYMACLPGCHHDRRNRECMKRVRAHTLKEFDVEKFIVNLINKKDNAHDSSEETEPAWNQELHDDSQSKSAECNGNSEDDANTNVSSVNAGGKIPGNTIVEDSDEEDLGPYTSLRQIYLENPLGGMTARAHVGGIEVYNAFIIPRWATNSFSNEEFSTHGGYRIVKVRAQNIFDNKYGMTISFVLNWPKQGRREEITSKDWNHAIFKVTFDVSDRDTFLSYAHQLFEKVVLDNDSSAWKPNKNMWILIAAPWKVGKKKLTFYTVFKSTHQIFSYKELEK